MHRPVGNAGDVLPPAAAEPLITRTQNLGARTVGGRTKRHLGSASDTVRVADDLQTTDTGT
jgi:hypothetical protein